MFAFKTHFTPKPTSTNHLEKSNTCLLTYLPIYLLTYLLAPENARQRVVMRTNIAQCNHLRGHRGRQTFR